MVSDIEDLFARRKKVNRLPKEISEDLNFLKAVKSISKKYDFEIEKTLCFIIQNKSKCIGLQFPEGLLNFSFLISTIIKTFCPYEVEIVILGDVSYGACCVDDYSAKQLGCDLLVHYGHSCLVPINQTLIKMLYVFVEISVSTKDLIQTIENNFKKEESLCLVSTIQFSSLLDDVKKDLIKKGFSVQIPQTKPLSKGEILGCTSPKVKDADVSIYFGDGRFHVESFIIANPKMKVFCYDPYTKKLTKETYDHKRMFSIRQKDIEETKKARVVGIVLSTLGRQGSLLVLKNILNTIGNKAKVIVVLMSQIRPEKLNKLLNVDSWVQIACPRLSIDWRESFIKPIITPYELSVVFDAVKWQEEYPMDYYSIESLGQWTVNNRKNTFVKNLIK